MGPRSRETISRPRLPQVIATSDPTSLGSAIRTNSKPLGTSNRSRYVSLSTISFQGDFSCGPITLTGFQPRVSNLGCSQAVPSGAVVVATQADPVSNGSL